MFPGTPRLVPMYVQNRELVINLQWQHSTMKSEHPGRSELNHKKKDGNHDLLTLPFGSENNVAMSLWKAVTELPA